MRTKDSFTPWDMLYPYKGTMYHATWPTLKELFEITVKRFGPRVCWKEFVPNPVSYTYSEALVIVKGISSWLISSGIRKGDKVIVSGKNSVAWGFGYFAVLFAGATVVPLDNALSDEDFIKLSEFSDSVAMFADSNRLMKVASKLPLKAVACLEDNGPVEWIMRKKAENIEAEPCNEDDIAQIIFTSGTTGTPKGVMLSHKNLVSDIFLSQANMNIFETDVFYAILPIHHAYTLLSVLLVALGVGASVVFGKKLVVSQILKELKEGEVTMFLGVPILFNKMYAAVVDGLKKKGLLVYGLIRGLMGISGWLKRTFGINVGKHWFKFLLKKLSLDTNRICICGGGPLPESTFRGFNELGIDFVQGYGLTETSPITHLNPIYAFIESSVGKAVASTECKIVNPDEDGNGLIYIRGPQVMKGYYKNPEATAEVLDQDGWLNTGDIGQVDENNYLYLSGRAKSVIVSDGGKNVFPEEIEDKFQLYSEIEQLCVIGYIKNKQSAGERVRIIILPTEEFAEGKTSEAIQERMDHIVREVNATLLPYKRIEMVTVVDEPLSMTSSKKVRRSEVSRTYEIA
ncbi:MAG: AMP-binding protein [Sphaerochaeta sp.]|nr:AMP-binding protein [Sphaerochaeta sp.]